MRKLLGQSFVFYLKHWTEMKALYGYDEADSSAERVAKDLIATQPSPDEFRERINLVGDTACRQGASFLSEIADRVMDRIREQCRIEKKLGKRFKSEWEMNLKIEPKKPPTKKYKGQWYLGCNIIQSETPLLICWVWAQGGADSEERLYKILRDKLDKKTPRSKDLGWKPGLVILGKIPLLQSSDSSLELDGKPIIEQAVHLFTQLTRQDLNSIFTI